MPKYVPGEPMEPVTDAEEEEPKQSTLQILTTSDRQHKYAPSRDPAVKVVRNQYDTIIT